MQRISYVDGLRHISSYQTLPLGNKAEIWRKHQDVQQKPGEKRIELLLFYQLKSDLEDEMKTSSMHLVSQHESSLKTLTCDELGLSKQADSKMWLAALSAFLITAARIFIPIVLFFFIDGFPEIIFHICLALQFTL